MRLSTVFYGIFTLFTLGTAVLVLATADARCDPDRQFCLNPLDERDAVVPLIVLWLVGAIVYAVVVSKAQSGEPDQIGVCPNCDAIVRVRSPRCLVCGYDLVRGSAPKPRAPEGPRRHR